MLMVGVGGRGGEKKRGRDRERERREKNSTNDLINLHLQKELFHKYSAVVKAKNEDSGARVPGLRLELDCV